ncbi:MAG: cysteine desulfurase family protein [Thermodesulfovibrionales bacterium]
MIYFDHNATTPLDPAVWQTMSDCLRLVYGNPSSSHRPGREARAVVDQARARVAALLGCEPEEVCFTSGGTEANNLAIIGTARRHANGHIISSRIEHPSVLNPLRALEHEGFRVTLAPVDSRGRVVVEEVLKALSKDTVLITIMHSNNETGVLQPVAEIAEIAADRGIAFHTDAAQSIGKTPVTSAGVDMLTVVPHKFYGPKGTGALFIRRSMDPMPILFGAAHERGLRPGTENVAGIAGLGMACELASARLAETSAHLARLRQALYDGLREAVPGVALNGDLEDSLPNTLNVRIPGVEGSALAARVGEELAISAGSACHAGRSIPSPVLMAMGLSAEEALSSVRISLGRDNTDLEVREAVRILSDACRRPGRGR